jgi:hypothetical protein
MIRIDPLGMNKLLRRKSRLQTVMDTKAFFTRLSGGGIGNRLGECRKQLNSWSHVQPGQDAKRV